MADGQPPLRGVDVSVYQGTASCARAVRRVRPARLDRIRATVLGSGNMARLRDLLRFFLIFVGPRPSAGSSFAE
jgi:hypothetical protein